MTIREDNDRTSAPVIRRCRPADFVDILAVINDGAGAYRDAIPADCWREPHMSPAGLEKESAAGVAFWVCEERGEPVTVMGLQDVADVTLIRHAYTRTSHQGKGLGSALLTHLRAQTARPILIGTWKAAS